MATKKRTTRKTKTAVARKKAGARKNKAAAVKKKVAAGKKKAPAKSKKAIVRKKAGTATKKRVAGKKKVAKNVKKKPAAKKKPAKAGKKKATKAAAKKTAGKKKTAKNVKKKPAAKKKATKAATKKPTAKKKATKTVKKKPAAKKKPATTSTRKSSAAAKPIIVVTGATGAQGGSLVRALLADPARTFAVRAVTRNAETDSARELKRLGADVVKADLDDLASLKRAFKGAFGAYCVTNYWEHFSPGKETQQAVNLAEAAKAAKLQHVIWSTFEDTRKWVPLEDTRMPTLMGKYKVPHFDAKAEANQVFRDLGVPTTMLLTSFYWDNLIHFGMGPQKGPDNVYAITLPMGDRRLPGIARDDIGRCAFGIFKAGTKYINRTVGIAGEHLTGADMAAALSKALGVPVRYNEISADDYRGLGFPGADDLGNMFQFKRDFNGYYCGARDVARSRALNASLQSFATWLEKNKARMPL